MIVISMRSTCVCFGGDLALEIYQHVSLSISIIIIIIKIPCGSAHDLVGVPPKPALSANDDINYQNLRHSSVAIADSKPAFSFKNLNPNRNSRDNDDNDDDEKLELFHTKPLVLITDLSVSSDAEPVKTPTIPENRSVIFRSRLHLPDKNDRMFCTGKQGGRDELIDRDTQASRRRL